MHTYVYTIYIYIYNYSATQHAAKQRKNKVDQIGLTRQQNKIVPKIVKPGFK